MCVVCFFGGNASSCQTNVCSWFLMRVVECWKERFGFFVWFGIEDSGFLLLRWLGVVYIDCMSLVRLCFRHPLRLERR